LVKIEIIKAFSLKTQANTDDQDEKRRLKKITAVFCPAKSVSEINLKMRA